MFYKKGDRIQGMHSGRFGAVHQDQVSDVVNVVWDEHPGEIHGVNARDLRRAPWHGIKSPIDFPDPVHLRNFRAAGLISIDIDSIVKDYGPLDDDVEFTEAGSINADKSFTYKKGDRVKLKYNRMTGTVLADQVQAGVWVHWDKHAEGSRSAVPVKDLVTLHAPRDTDAVNPNQKAIDEIEKQRKVLKKEVEDLQSRLAVLTQAKKLLERG